MLDQLQRLAGVFPDFFVFSWTDAGRRAGNVVVLQHWSDSYVLNVVTDFIRFW